MRSIIVASSSQNMLTKLNRILLTFQAYDIYYCKTEAELYSLCDRLDGGVLIVSAFRDTSVNDIKNSLSLDWDIVSILPPGVPVPFYSSNLTVFTAPVNISEFLSTVEMLMNITDYKKTLYDEVKANSIDEAKRILIKKKGLSEDQAHYFLQKTSMDKGISIKKIAEKIIKDNKNQKNPYR